MSLGTCANKLGYYYFGSGSEMFICENILSIPAVAAMSYYSYKVMALSSE